MSSRNHDHIAMPVGWVWVLAGCAVSFPRPAAAEVVFEPGPRIRIVARATLLPGTRSVVEQCVRALGNYLELPEGGDEPILSVIVSEDDTGRPGRLRVFLSETTPLTQTLHAINLALLRRRLAAVTGKDPRQVRRLHWAAAALTYAELYTREGTYVSRRPDYQPARHVYLQGTFPDPEWMIEAPIPAANELAYLLSSVHCHLLANILRSARPNRNDDALRAVLTELAAGNAPEQVLPPILKRYFGHEGTVGDWFRDEALDRSRLGRSSQSVDDVLARLQEVSSVPVLMPGSSGRFVWQTVPAEDVFERLKDYQFTPAALRAAERDLFEVSKDAPLLLRPSLVAYMQAFAAFRQSANRRRFREDLKEARVLLNWAVGQQRAMATYLDDIGRQVVPAAGRFRLYLQALEDRRAAQRRLAPAIHAYLDSLERPPKKDPGNPATPVSAER